MFYILIFKVNESRRRYVAMAVAVTGIFLTHLLKEISYQWGAEIAIAAMIAIVMIGWLYPARG
ncbi:MAG: hypothetical protein J2P41_01025 [Blastocatellia bacterium]|nr:hypothetical protein [Blastocatellia bacterium]